MSEHNIKNHIVGNSLKLKIALGYINRNTIADSQYEYFDSEQAMFYSSLKSEIAMSPEVKMTGTKARKQSWNTNQQVENLLVRMYNGEDSCLIHGFVKQHKSTFTMAVSAIIKGGIRNEGNYIFSKLWKTTHLS